MRTTYRCRFSIPIDPIRVQHNASWALHILGAMNIFATESFLRFPSYFARKEAKSSHWDTSFLPAPQAAWDMYIEIVDTFFVNTREVIHSGAMTYVEHHPRG